MELSPDCKNTGYGFVCGLCGKCGRKFKWRRSNPNEPLSTGNNSYPHIIKASLNDSEHIKEKAENQDYI